MKKEIAIIGYGRFGRCAAHHLKKRFRVFVADTRPLNNVEQGVHKVSIETAATKTSIILAIPINQVPVTLKRISNFLQPEALICEVCSVKEQPIQWMKHLLPKNVDILGTHPLFGPDSASTSLIERTIVLCPARIRQARLRHVRKALTTMGLNVVTMKAAQHDRLMASTLFLTQFVGRGLLSMDLPRTTISTQHFRFLQQLVRTAENDTKELFHDMYRYNRFATRIPSALVDSFRKTLSSLSSR
jgi:prephenate dehydrogenase